MAFYKLNIESGTFSEPILQNDILQTAEAYLHHYLFYDNWIAKYAAILLFLYGLYKLLTCKSTAVYPQFLPPEKYPCSLKGKSNCCGALFLLLCFAVYAFNLYAQEMSFFASYDAMGPNNMLVLHQGITPMWGYNRRFSPVAFWDNNLVYAITHNHLLISGYVLAQAALIIGLLFRLLNFIPVGKRCCIIGLLVVAPQFMWTNSIIFPERLLLVYILCSLIFFQKYGENPQRTSNLWYGILFTNMAIYTKESTILFYFGILPYSFIYNLMREKIVLKSFLHPLRTARQFPLEILLAASMIIFAVFYLCNVYAIADSPYISLRRREICESLRFYRPEIVGLAAAVLIWLLQLKKKQSYFLSGGLLLGSVVLTAFVVLYLRLVPFSNQVAHKNYYLLLPAGFVLIYVLQKIKSNKIFWVVSSLLFAGFLGQNIYIFGKEEGKYYRQTAEFITSRPEPLSVFISAHSEPRPWWDFCWLSAYKYYWPHKKILFKLASFQIYPSDEMFLGYLNTHPEIFHPSVAATVPTSGDIYVVKTNGNYYETDMQPILELPHRLIYKNPVFEIYRIE